MMLKAICHTNNHRQRISHPSKIWSHLGAHAVPASIIVDRSIDPGCLRVVPIAVKARIDSLRSSPFSLTQAKTVDFFQSPQYGWTLRLASYIHIRMACVLSIPIRSWFIDRWKPQAAVFQGNPNHSRWGEASTNLYDWADTERRPSQCQASAFGRMYMCQSNYSYHFNMPKRSIYKASLNVELSIQKASTSFIETLYTDFQYYLSYQNAIRCVSHRSGFARHMCRSSVRIDVRWSVHCSNLLIWHPLALRTNCSK